MGVLGLVWCFGIGRRVKYSREMMGDEGYFGCVQLFITIECSGANSWGEQRIRHVEYYQSLRRKSLTFTYKNY